MIDKINPAAAAGIYKQTGNDAAGIAGNDKASFGDMVKKAGRDAVESLRHSEKMSAEAVTGEADLVDVVQAVTNAEMTLQTVVTMRDRMMSAYQEIMRMPV